MKDFKTQILIAITILVAIALWLSAGGNSRYQIAGLGKEGVCVLDTKTSRLWFRNTAITLGLGTNQNPERSVIKTGE